MLCLKGDSEIILAKIKHLNNSPPRNWTKYTCKDERFSYGYYWFEYVGKDYPSCLLYIPYNAESTDKVSFMILVIEKSDERIITENFKKIAYSFFGCILDDKINLEEN